MKNFAKILALVLVGVICVAVLASCAPASDPAKAKAALEKNGYNTIYLVGDIELFASRAIYGDNLTAKLTGTKTVNSKLDIVTIYYFADKDSATAAYEKINTESDKEKNAEETDWVVAQSGKMVYYGTKAAIEAAR